MKKLFIAASLALVTGATAAADFFVVLPIQKSGALPPSITVALNNYSLPDATVGGAYSFDFKTLLTTTGDSTPDVNQASFSLASGALPVGLSLDAGGTLAGQPSAAGSTSFQVLASYKGANGQQTYTIKVNGSVYQVSSLAAGWNHACAVMADGTAKCWGDNAYGQLGNNSTVASQTPVAVSNLTSVASIQVGSRHSCAVLTDGNVKCWGSNDMGQVGDTTTVNKLVPTSPWSLGPVVSLAVGAAHTCAARAAGGVVCWGYNGSKQIGDGSFAGSIARYPRVVTGLAAGTGYKVGAGLSHSCYTRVGLAACWGDGSAGQLGNGTTAQQSTPQSVTGLTDADEIYGGYGYTTCTLTTAKGVKCWGSNAEGELGQGVTSAYSRTPVQVPGLSSGVSSLSLGRYHACALLTGGELRCWGSNSNNQLTSGKANPTAAPATVSGFSGTPGKVSAGYHSTCVSTSTGMQCWGDNTYGQLGNGTTTSAGSPVPVTLQ